MAPAPNGVYAISRPGEQLLTLMGAKEAAVILPPNGNPGEQEWAVESLSNGNVTIRNLKEQTYLGYDGDPSSNMPTMGRSEPQEWALYQSAEPFAFHIVVPGGPVDGTELALDMSLLRIFPPRLALRPLDVSNQRQAWRLQFME